MEMDIEALKKSLDESKARCLALEKEKDQLRAGFEEKRSKFKDVYQAKEKLVSEQALELESLRAKLNQNEEKINAMILEIKDLKMIASVSENTKQEAVDNLEKRHQDEMESLRKAMEDSNEESQQNMVRHFERERRQWEKKLSSMKYDKEALEMQLDEARKKIEHDANYSEEEELEASMKKAHEEAEKLKSVVLPLEKEISKLKEELELTKKDLEKSQSVAAELNAKASKAEETAAKSPSLTESQDSVLELGHSLKSEKSSRTDLERYVEVLQDQKKEIENECESLKHKIRSIHKQFDQEKAEHSVLKETWLAANDQFLESQRLLMRDNNIIEGVLSEEQRRQVKMLKLKAQASEAREAKSPMSSLALLKSKTDKFKEVLADSISQKSDTDSDTQSFGSYQEFHDAADGHHQKLTLKLTDTRTTHQSDYIDGSQIVPGPGQKVISETEWEEMLNEIRVLRNKSARARSGTSSSTPGQKHADLFDDDAKMAEEIKVLSAKVKLYEEEKAKEAERTKSLEESIRFSAEDAQKQITELTNKLNDFERLLGNLNEKQVKARAEDKINMDKLNKEKDKYRDELFASKKERAKLAQQQEKHQQTLLKENAPLMAKLPETAQSLVATYRKSLAMLRAEKDLLETKYKNEIVFMEERLKAEQSTRDQMESSLASELHDARGEIISLQSLKSVKDDLKKVQDEKEELERQLEKRQTSYDALQTKSAEIIKGLREKQLAEVKAKEDVESALADAKHKLQSLHSALETSEHVQRDFVRLSQSLQVQLEQVRQERERERKSDAETSSVQSLELPASSSNQSGDDGSNPRSPALSPQQGRRKEPESKNAKSS